MSTVFEVPCPECGRHMSVAAGGELQCATCERTYHARMGHLFPVGEPQAPRSSSPRALRAVAQRVVRQPRRREDRAGRPALRSGPAGCVRRDRAGDRDAVRRSGGAGPRGDPVRAGDLGDGSEAGGVQQPLRERLSREEMVDLAPHLHLQMLAELYRRGDEFDIVHSHLDIWTFPFTELRDTPTVLTMHGRLDLDFLRDLLPRYASVPLVSISDDQRRAVADLDLTWAATVYNGLDFTSYQDVPHDSDGYLGFVGRIAEEKGPLAAIEIARRSRAAAPDGGQGRPPRRGLLRGGGEARDGP